MDFAHPPVPDSPVWDLDNLLIDHHLDDAFGLMPDVTLSHSSYTSSSSSSKEVLSLPNEKYGVKTFKSNQAPDLFELDEIDGWVNNLVSSPDSSSSLYCKSQISSLLCSPASSKDQDALVPALLTSRPAKQLPASKLDGLAQVFGGTASSLQAKKDSRPGSDIAARLAQLVRKRRQNDVSNSEKAAVVPVAAPKFHKDETGNNLPWRNRDSVPVYVPRFSIAKEAILRSMGVDTSSPPEVPWLPLPESDIPASQAMAVKNTMPPHILRSTLLTFAEAVAMDDRERIHVLHGVLEEETDLNGSSAQRIAALFMICLDARMKQAGIDKYFNLLTFKQSEEGALWEFVSKLPCLQFWMESVAGVQYQALHTFESIHIVDLSVWIGQWKPLIDQLALLKTVRHVRITAVSAPPGSPNGIGPVVKSEVYEGAIRQAARAAGISLELKVLPIRLEDLKVSDLNLRPGEAVSVNCGLRLAQLMDSTVVRSNPRDSFLRVLRELNPVVVTMAEFNMDSNGPFFMARIREALDVYTLIYDSNSHIKDHTVLGRKLFEQKIFGREILNLVSCEGIHRVVRHEKPATWQTRMWRAGFVPRQLSRGLESFLHNSMREKIQGFKVERHENGWLQLFYREKLKTVVMAWQPIAKKMLAVE